MSKYYFSFFLWMPSEETDIGQETMCFSMYSYPAVRSWDSPDVQWTSVGHKCNCITCIPAPAKWGRNSWNIQVNLIRTRIWNSVYYCLTQYQQLSCKSTEILHKYYKKLLDWNLNNCVNVLWCKSNLYISLGRKYNYFPNYFNITFMGCILWYLHYIYYMNTYTISAKLKSNIWKRISLIL